MPAKRVLVVGGGSAGWVTAAYLNAALNRRGEGGRRTLPVSITLVESPHKPRIGVGEATVPTIRHVLQTIGVSESAFMKATDATFKQAIKFVNWLNNDGESYYHPFDRRQAGPVDYAADAWLSSKRDREFAYTVSVQPHLCERGQSPRMMNSKDFSSPMPYAYHMDAEKFADYLCEVATAEGVTHVLDDVTEVQQAEDGSLEAVLTAGGHRLEADLFIDCTGFAGLLIEKALGVTIDDYSPWLLCDRAVAMRVPYETWYPGHVRPYTSATALSAGWTWDIALANRRGIGYVYSSAFLDDESAERELRAYEGSHAADVSARHLKFRVGKRKTFWSHNCIAIGLAGGFIEPLESTGIYLSEFAAVTLAEHFPFTSQMAPLAARFNQIMSNRYAEICDFVNMHYCLTQRTDTEFWRAVQRPEHITDSLKEKFNFWRLKPPSASDFDDQFRLFSYQSYEYILYGMDFNRGGYADRYPETREEARVIDRVARIVDAAESRLPSHEAWLSTELGHRSLAGHGS